MAQPLGFDPALFALHGLPTQLAGYYAIQKGGLNAFIRKMDRRFHAPEVVKRRKRSAQHKALAALGVRRIYTTNFEHHIEDALRDARKPVRVLARLEDFSIATPPGACEVVKFHGDLDYPETVVLTEGQVFDRFRLEAAPDQCLRVDLLGNSFLFIGYSFSDINIRYIWYRMDRLRRESGPARGRAVKPPRSYWATFGAGAIQAKLLDDWHIDVIALDPLDPPKSVAQLLQTISSRSYP
jgi:hypothetical protein